jgi:hypothetical protein
MQRIILIKLLAVTQPLSVDNVDLYGNPADTSQLHDILPMTKKAFTVNVVDAMFCEETCTPVQFVLQVPTTLDGMFTCHVM